MSLIKFLAKWLSVDKWSYKNNSDSDYKLAGAIPSKKDNRDFPIEWLTGSVTILPEKVMLKNFQPIKNQMNLNACVGFAFTSIIEKNYIDKTGDKEYDLSEMYAWKGAKIIAGTLIKNVGVQMRDCLKSLKNKGICFEMNEPYDLNAYWTEPSMKANIVSSFMRIKSYYAVYSVVQAKYALSEGHPVAIGMTLYKPFITLSKDDVYDKPSNYNNLMHHAMVIVGYDDTKQAFRVRNSWGSSWCNNGYCWISYEAYKRYVYEAWVIEVRK